MMGRLSFNARSPALGYGNLPFALLLIAIIYYNEFVLANEHSLPT